MSLLKRTYQHIRGISIKKENDIWQAGGTYWENTLENIDKLELNENIKEKLVKELPKSIRLFEKKNYAHFLHLLPKEQAYRMYPYMKNETVFLDIETTGIKPDDSFVTVIGCYDGKETRVFIHGENEFEFLDYIRKFKIIVTFNGSLFDIPFLEKYFATTIKAKQIDLCFVLKDLGYTGGLKKIETDVGISRGDDMNGVNGYTAVLLWKYYEMSGDKSALDTLIHYNLLDTINLEYLLIFAYNKYAEKFNSLESVIEEKDLPSIYYKNNKILIDYLHKNSYKYSQKQS